MELWQLICVDCKQNMLARYFISKNNLFGGKKKGLQFGLCNHGEPCATPQGNKGEKLCILWGRGREAAVVTITVLPIGLLQLTLSIRTPPIGLLVSCFG